MNVRFLIDSIVQQTTILIAQLATSGGIRAPLAHIVNQVFLELAKELDSQGVSRKVSADMFGMALRAYQRKLQRLNESSTDRGRSLWEAMIDFLLERDMVTRGEILRRFYRDDEAVVKSVLKDLIASGMVFRSGTGTEEFYRATTEEELGRIRRFNRNEGFDEFLWALIYRTGPLRYSELLKRITVEPKQLQESLQRLLSDGRLHREEQKNDTIYSSNNFFVPLDTNAGWEAAVFDQYQAVVQTICCKLRANSSRAAADDEIGGSTYTLDIWPGHPLEKEARDWLRRFREEMSSLRSRIKQHNIESGLEKDYDRVVIYGGQCIIPR